MAHFAKLNDNSVVINVNSVHNDCCIDPVTGEEEEAKGIEFLIQWSGGYTNWKQTSYNGNFRKNYAGIGYTYLADIDAFIPPKPFNSWILNEDTCRWDAPIAMPADAGTGEPPKRYTWSEDTINWVEVE